MGQSYKVAWAEIWDEVKDVFANARLTGQATMKDDDCLFMKRSGFLEETYFSWSIIPMVGEHGTVMGLYNPAFEKVAMRPHSDQFPKPTVCLRHVSRRVYAKDSPPCVFANLMLD